MIYRRQIIEGLRYLRRVKNSDGGIPATLPGAVSGCWTSAEALETLLSAPYHETDPRPFALDLIRLLGNTQLTTGEHSGGWPLVTGGVRASTMATGHAVAALYLARQYFCDDPSIVAEIEQLINAGLQWLSSNKNPNSGWGVEPGGGIDGSKPRMISTIYALRAYFAAGKTYENSHTVREAVDWIKTLENGDNGFSGQIGDASDPCNSARAVVALLRSGHKVPSDKLIKRTIGYITAARPRRKLWPLDTETYVTEGAPGQTVFNSNTTADVLEAYLRAGVFNKHTEDLVTWFLLNQKDDGAWFLGANKAFVYAISTWSTNEAIFALSLAAQVYADRKLPHLERRYQAFRRIAVALALIVFVQILFIVQLPSLITDLWNKIPESTRTLITWSVLVALMVNLLSSTLYDYLPWRRRPPRM